MVQVIKSDTKKKKADSLRSYLTLLLERFSLKNHFSISTAAWHLLQFEKKQYCLGSHNTGNIKQMNDPYVQHIILWTIFKNSYLLQSTLTLQEITRYIVHTFYVKYSNNK